MGKKRGKRSRRKKRLKGFSKLTRVQNKRQAIYGHAITHSPQYQKSKSPEMLKREHDFLVEHYVEKHKSPLAEDYMKRQ